MPFGGYHLSGWRAIRQKKIEACSKATSDSGHPSPELRWAAGALAAPYLKKKRTRSLTLARSRRRPSCHERRRDSETDSALSGTLQRPCYKRREGEKKEIR